MHSIHRSRIRSTSLGAHTRALLCLSTLRPHRTGAAATVSAEFLIAQILGIIGGKAAKVGEETSPPIGAYPPFIDKISIVVVPSSEETAHDIYNAFFTVVATRRCSRTQEARVPSPEAST